MTKPLSDEECDAIISRCGIGSGSSLVRAGYAAGFEAGLAAVPEHDWRTAAYICDRCGEHMPSVNGCAMEDCQARPNDAATGQINESGAAVCASEAAVLFAAQADPNADGAVQRIAAGVTSGPLSPSSAAPDVAGRLREPIPWEQKDGAGDWQAVPYIHACAIDDQRAEAAAEIERLTRERDEAGKVIAELVAAKDAGDAESKAFNERLQRGETVMMNWTWTTRISDAWTAARAWLAARPAKGEGK